MTEQSKFQNRYTILPNMLARTGVINMTVSGEGVDTFKATRGSAVTLNN